MASTGTVNLANAHPFTVGRIVGAHNGIVANHVDLNKSLGRTCAVDSEHIFRHLAEGRKLKEVHGWGAVTFTDEQALIVSRFNGGSLSLAETPIGYVWSSEKDVLVRACRMASLPISKIYTLGDNRRYVVGSDGIRKDGHLGVGKHTPAWTYAKGSPDWQDVEWDKTPHAPVIYSSFMGEDAYTRDKHTGQLIDWQADTPPLTPSARIDTRYLPAYYRRDTPGHNGKAHGSQGIYLKPKKGGV
jgi:hypothetical protein